MQRAPKGNLISSLRHAFEGLRYVLLIERNARVHLAVAVLVILVSFWLELSRVEWSLMIIAISLVFVGEMLNTVVEITIDLITLDHHPLAKHAKDVAAGAILFSAFAAAMLGLIILGPRLWQKLASIWNP
jgi:diacylglycerol kinase